MMIVVNVKKIDSALCENVTNRRNLKNIFQGTPCSEQEFVNCSKGLNYKAIDLLKFCWSEE